MHPGHYSCENSKIQIKSGGYNYFPLCHDLHAVAIQIMHPQYYTNAGTRSENSIHTTKINKASFPWCFRFSIFPN